MAESEEKLLKDYFQKIDAEAEELLDVKLDTAIRRGCSKGTVHVCLLVKGTLLLYWWSWHSPYL